MASARATAIFDADDSALRAAYLRADHGLQMMQARFGAVKSFMMGMVPVVASLGAIKKIGDVLDAGAELRETREATGLTIADILKLRKEFKLAGRDAETIAPGIQKMQKALVSGSADQALQKLGLNLQELRKKSPAEQFHEIGKAIAAMADPAERTAAAMAIFGKTGGTLLPVFANKAFGNATIKPSDQLMAKDADLFADTKNKIETLKPSFQGFFVGMGDQIIPVFRPLLDRLEKIDFATMGQSFAEPIAQVIQLFADGNLWKVSGDMLAIGCIDAVNLLFAGLVRIVTYAGAGLVAAAAAQLEVMGALTKPAFWAGLGQSLLGFANSFTAILLRGIASVLEALSKAPLIGGQGGKLATAAQVVRGEANATQQIADSNYSKAGQDFGAVGSEAWAGFQAKLQTILSAAAGIAKGVGPLIDTKDLQSELDAMLDKGEKNKLVASASSFANAKPTEGTNPAEDITKVPVVSSLQRIGGASGAGGGGVENLLRDHVSVARSTLQTNKEILAAIKADRWARLG